MDITNRGIEFLQTASDEPFFRWLHYCDPHVFYSAPAQFGQLVPDSPYHAEVRYVDAEIARILAALHQSELADRTLVVLTGDHGEGLGEHQENTHSHYVYETTIHVPLIFWGPSLIPEPRRVSDLVRSIDITPTVLALVGVPAPTDIQGISRRPLIDGRSQSLGLIAYGETLVPNDRVPARGPGAGSLLDRDLGQPLGDAPLPGPLHVRLETLEQANTRCPDSPDLDNDLAYALATTPEATLRDGPRALRLAQQAVDQGGGNPSYPDSLACAFAETGDYANALGSLGRALQMIEGQESFEEMRRMLHREEAQGGPPGP